MNKNKKCQLKYCLPNNITYFIHRILRNLNILLIKNFMVTLIYKYRYFLLTLT